MDVVVMSSGTDEDSQPFRDACRNAYDSGMILVAAAGNTHGGNVTYPARYDSVIAVTATNLNGSPASFSPIGPEIELAAPGVDILSTTRGDDYGYLSGTSQAAPHVAGTAALIISSKMRAKKPATATDATIALIMAVGATPATQDADVNGDSRVTSLDALIILQGAM